MLTASGALALFGALIALAVVPGPIDLALVSRSIASGFSHGLIMIGGILCADLVFIVVAIYGLSALAEAAGGLFTAVTSACGAYLIWLGADAIRHRSSALQANGDTRASPLVSFASGFLVTIGDAKVIVFYVGLFSLFVDVSRITVSGTMVIASLVVLAVGGIKLGFICVADRAKRLFTDSGRRAALHIAAGGVLIGTGTLLLLSSLRAQM